VEIKATPPVSQGYIDKRELASRTGLSVSTIQRYIDAGKIQCYQPGGKHCRVLFPANAVEVARRIASQGAQQSCLNSSNLPSKPLVSAKSLPGPSPRWRNSKKKEDN
jgi:excisionase family DNA binding protein